MDKKNDYRGVKNQFGFRFKCDPVLYELRIVQAHPLIHCLHVIVSNLVGNLNHDLVALTAELCEDIDLGDADMLR